MLLLVIFELFMLFLSWAFSVDSMAVGGEFLDVRKLIIVVRFVATAIIAAALDPKRVSCFQFMIYIHSN